VHDKGITHNDLKPANLFLNPDDSVLISDFGGATLFGEGPGQATQRYRAPEAPLSVRADIYSAGCIAYELLSGRAYYDVRNEAGPCAMVAAQVPRSLADAVRSSLAQDPLQRPQISADFAHPFQAFLDSLPSESSPDNHRLGPAPPKCFGRDEFV